MDNTREKLIELLGYETCKDKECIGCKHYSDEQGCIDYLKAELADHLVANGVTIGYEPLRLNCSEDFAEKLAEYLRNSPVMIMSEEPQMEYCGWIPVTERLPESYKLVLAVCKSGKIFVGEYVDLGWRTLWRIKTARDSTKEITRIVTHWMPLPEPPKP